MNEVRRFGLFQGLGWLLESFGEALIRFVFWLFVINVIPRFDFEGWIWVLIASVPESLHSFYF